MKPTARQIFASLAVVWQAFPVLGDQLGAKRCLSGPFTLKEASSFCSVNYEPEILSSSPLDIRSINSTEQNKSPYSSTWAFPPRCPEQQYGAERFCAFTSHTFAGGRGISIISTPSIVSDLRDSTAFSNLPNTMNTPYNVYNQLELPGKGLGLIANQPLHRGDRIFAHTPVLLISYDIYNQSLVSEDTRQELLRSAVYGLPKASQTLFFELMGHFGGDAIDDRIDTNSFEIDLGGTNHYAVFPETSRINHDCRPNSAYFFDMDTLTHYVHAITDVHPGTELSITYTNVVRPRRQRQKTLHKSWGFKCGCSLCSQSAVFTRESDLRIAQIDKLMSILEIWDGDVAQEIDPEMAETLIGLYEQERLWADIAAPYRVAAWSWNAVGQKWKATKYARLGIEYTMLDAGPSDEEIADLRSLIEEPEEHWSWMKRSQKYRLGSVTMKV
jgi:hypothetical protein